MAFTSRIETSPLSLGKVAREIAFGIAALAARTKARLARDRSASVLRTLDDDQLRDIGVARAAIEPARPVLEVDAALMRRLMSTS